MTTMDDLLKQGSKDQVWKKYCGHLDLSNNEYMQIQKRLLMEQFEILWDSEIGKKLFGKVPPKNIDAFRSSVPLTTYDFYAPYLAKQDESSLPKGKYVWAHTSGKSGQYEYKWVPYSRRMYTKLGEVVVGAMILSSCKYKGDITIESGDVLLVTTAPRPYYSGYVSTATLEEVSVKFVPPIEEAEKMTFNDRLSIGFDLAMASGLDYFFGLASIMVKIGEKFEQGSSSSGFSSKMLDPKYLARSLRGMARAKLHHRALLPRDVWNVKGIMTGGMDTDVYRDRIEHYWGKYPLEGYACTEGGMLGMQSWNFKGMTLFPDCDFYEFIPLEEHEKNKKNPAYQPKTVLMDELKPGIYELVFTNLLGGVICRYRVGDLLKVTSVRDEEIGVDIPQIRFYSRADDLIDLGSMARFTELQIWQAIESTGIPYVDWSARKEEVKREPILHLYIELDRSNKLSLDKVKSKIRTGLQQTCPDFKDMEAMLNGDHLMVTQLPTDTFNIFIMNQQKAGADLAHTKPPRMQASDEIVKRLLEAK